MIEITQELLKEYFEYQNGHLYWIKVRSNRLKIGQRAGTEGGDGYITIYLYSKPYREHRLIWLYHYGCWPKEHLDHINGIRDDNRIENLRETDQTTNKYNRKSCVGSSSSYKGVSWHKRSKKWEAAYRSGNKKKLI